MKKRSFVLLEILIAISIISMLAGFLIYRPFRELKKELEMILSIEEARVWEGELIKLESELRSACTDLPKTRATAKGKDAKFTVSIGDIERKCKRTYKAWAEEKQEAQGISHYLIDVVMKKGKRFPHKPDYKFYQKVNRLAVSPVPESRPD